jgi:hypothetical protein
VPGQWRCLRALISPSARLPCQDGHDNPAWIADRAVRRKSETMAIKPPRSIRPTTSGLRHQHPEEPSRARGASRSRVSSTCVGRSGFVQQDRAICLHVSDCSETSSATGERWSRTRSEAAPRHAQPATHQEGRYRERDRSRLDRRLASLVRPRLGGENKAIFLDVSDCLGNEFRSGRKVVTNLFRSRPEPCPASSHPAP